MSFPFFVQWTVLSAETLNIERHCARCGRITAFTSTEKFRLNANGNRLDAWLIYQCRVCSNRWNRTLFERRPVRSLPPATIEALQGNDAGLARSFAVQLPTRTDRFRPGGADAFRIEAKILSLARPAAGSLELVVLNPANLQVRLDRVLAEGLSVSRNKVHALAEAGVFRSRGASRKALRQPIGEKTVLEIPGQDQQVLPGLQERLLRNDRDPGD
ncbi:MAG: DUF1062 domain-containing protein [Pseudomonadota bacterium]